MAKFITKCVLTSSFVVLAFSAGFAQRAGSKLPVLDGHLVWVLSFENSSAQPGVDWIGTSFPDILSQRLSSAGFLTIRREDRQYALAHLGLPVDFHPTQATTYRIAQTLDADYVVFGNYTVANGSIAVTARLLVMSGPRMESTIEEHGNLDQLIDLEDELAWKVAMQIDPSLHLDEQTFLAAGRNLRLDAFEDYIRGELAPSAEQRIAHLARAVQLSPGYMQAWFALGKAYFANQQYEEAEIPFSKIPSGNRLWLESRFYAGLSDLYRGNYSKAQSEFAAIAAVLPMPEVLNNEGIAVNRRGQNGTAFFERVVQLDPQNADYWFNLAVSQRRMKNYPAALKAVDRSLALRPQDQEAQALKKNLSMVKEASVTGKAAMSASPAPQIAGLDAESSSAAPATLPAESSPPAPQGPTTPMKTGGEDYEPLERIARAYDESSFRQAAFEMEQMRALKLRSMIPASRARLLCQQGNEYVGEGLLLEAERQFQLAVAADPSSAAGYAGLAEVHEHTGSTQAAKQDAGKSIAEKPNVAAYLVLARIALAEHSYPTAQENVEHALALDPKNSAARGILQAIETQQAALPQKP